MKKFISVITASAVLCALTACGKKESGGKEIQTPPEYQQKISVSDIAVEYSTEPQKEAITVTTTTRTAYTAELTPETTAPYVPVQYIPETTTTTTTAYTEMQYTEEFSATTVTTASAPPENAVISADIYSAVENYLECINNKDIYGIIKASYPDKYADAIKSMADSTDIALEDFIGDAYKEKNMHLSGANSYETMSADYVSKFSSLLGSFEPLRVYIEKNGIGDTDFLSILESICSIPDGAYFEITKAVKINCNISSDGKGTKARDMVIYYIDGEGWKIDIVFMPCIESIDGLKNNEFINSLNDFICDIGGFVEENITGRIHGYDDYYSDSYYYDDFNSLADAFEDGVSGFFEDIMNY